MDNNFRKTVLSVEEKFSRRVDLEILQVNLGNMCNQRCAHCHVDAGPKNNKIMPVRIMDDIVRFLSNTKGLILDVTGGCPELNPNFRYFIEKAKPEAKKVMVRNNLTVLFDAGMEYLPRFYKMHKIKLICSLPCYTKENVDRQRGSGVFEKSIRALKLLNDLGYGSDKELELDLVYNPGGAFLPGDQADLEKDYKRVLHEQYRIVFNHLLTITNAPINRFEQYLKANGNFDAYMKLLMDNFNRDTASNIMCRNLLNVGWDGIVYDCDFNQALGLAMRDKNNKIMEISNLKIEGLEEKEITFENHCFCCTAGDGSSCRGALE